jgi:exonuclease SbcD
VVSVRLVHSSDLHLGMHLAAGVEALEVVLAASRRLEADVTLLVGDVFDHNRVPDGLLEAAAAALEQAHAPVVILPGNHDCLAENSVYRRALSDVAGVHVLGVTSDAAVFDDLDLEVWGRPHLDHFDMTPLADLPARRARWHVVAAHGHWVEGAHDLHRSYLITQDELRDTGADYVALGHWDRATPVGDGTVPAYYSGSPHLARTVNLVELVTGSPVGVRREPIWPE